MIRRHLRLRQVSKLLRAILLTSIPSTILFGLIYFHFSAHVYNFGSSSPVSDRVESIALELRPSVAMQSTALLASLSCSPSLPFSFGQVIAWSHSASIHSYVVYEGILYYEMT